uniref:Uncharacterized protein n=1 Tax=Bombyx mori TaxID=7091 RepID=A0A8R2HSN2_BOMMO|nr:uncharacterized protein LOC101744665 isoform X1 [Bombyx mori]
MFVIKISLSIIYSLQLCSTIDADEFKTKDTILKLNPVELLDLVLEEQLSAHGRTKPIIDVNDMGCTEYDRDDVIEGTDFIEHANKDEERLKARKVWSRWSKWSGCSVSCGEGNIVRWRVCVAGRCALNEREEQLRPCTRAPCNDPIDDTHDSE